MGSTPIRASDTMSPMRMVNLSRALAILSAALFLSSCSVFSQPKGGVKVTSNQISDIYLDAKNIGTTPLSNSPLEVKKYQLRIVPQDPSFAPEETQVKLFPGFETTVDWLFGKTKDDSSGYIFEAENAHKRDASELEITTDPDNVPININGENKGFSPLVVDSLPVGDYQLGLQAPGYNESNRSVRLMKGKRLLVTVKLARKPLDIAATAPTLAPLPAPVTTPRPTPRPTPKLTTSTSSSSAVLGKSTAKKPYIEVLDTPTGFLRVRSKPAADGDILGQLNVGETVPYGGTTTDNWFKIVFGATSSAWVSGQYSRLVQ